MFVSNYIYLSCRGTICAPVSPSDQNIRNLSVAVGPNVLVLVAWRRDDVPETKSVNHFNARPMSSMTMVQPVQV